MRILVIGGTGFVGRCVIGKLVAEGHVVHVPTRRLSHARELQVHPTVTVLEADVHNDATLQGLVTGCDVVINLVGILHSRAGQPYGPDFDRAHVQLPRRVALACVRNGVKQFLHISALGASATGPSGYLRSKAAGEQAMREIYSVEPSESDSPSFTFFRPSVMFGPEDQFMNKFAQLARFLPIFPLAGARARLQPIFVDDVATAMLHSLGNPKAAGKTYDLAGPRIYTLAELVELAALWSGHPRQVLELPLPLGRLQAWVFECLPGEPLMSRDNLDSLSVDNVSTTPISPDLDLVPTPLESVAPLYLKPTRIG
jgi:NADH dehydrogenase